MDNAFKIRGTVKVINETVQITQTFSKREFVITTDLSSPYPQHIMFQTIQDKCVMLDNVQINDTIDVSFNLRGREWISPAGDIKYFNTLDAWRIEVVEQSGTAKSGIPKGGASPMDLTTNTSQAQTENKTLLEEEEKLDDLPF